MTSAATIGHAFVEQILGLDEPLDLPVGEIFTAALANCYIYCG